MKEEMVVIVDNRLWQSLGRDIATLGTFVSMIGLGVFLQSSAMQWVGGLIWFLWVIGRAAIVEKKARMTIPQARAFLDKLEGRKP